MDCAKLRPGRTSVSNGPTRRLLLTLTVLSLLSTYSVAAFCSEHQRPTRVAPPRSLLTVTESSNTFLVAGNPDNVSLVRDGDADAVWTHHVDATLAGITTVPTPDGLHVFAADVRGHVYAWNADGRPLPGWPRVLDGVTTAAPTWIRASTDAVVIPTHGGRIHGLDMGGTPLPGWPVEVGARVLSAAASATVDGAPVVFAATEDGALWGFRDTGHPLRGFPVRFETRFIASPAIADVTGDGSPEIVIGGTDGRVWMLDSAGRVVDGWPVKVPSAVGTAAAFGDVDADGNTDIVVASRAAGVWALGVDGETLDGWPMKTLGKVLAAPTVADVDGAAGDEVLVTTYGGWAHCWNGAGTSLEEWPRYLGVMSRTSPVVIPSSGGQPLARVALPDITGFALAEVAAAGGHTPDEEDEPAATGRVPAAFAMRMSVNPLFLSHGDNAAVHVDIPEGLANDMTTIVVYDVSGRRVAEVFSGVLSPGSHVLPWRHGADLSTGVYFVRARTGAASITTKALIFR